jgi:hypothetical protein
MKVSVALAALGLLVSGCAAGFANPAGLTSVASAIGEVGATATGFKSTKSATELNDANKELVQAQAAMTQTQVSDSEVERKRLTDERVVTAKLLKGMADSYHEPVFLTLAEWVEAGGDPDFAFKYALTHIQSDEHTKVIPQQAVLLSVPIQAASASSAALKASPDQTATVIGPNTVSATAPTVSNSTSPTPSNSSSSSTTSADER